MRQSTKNASSPLPGASMLFYVRREVLWFERG